MFQTYLSDERIYNRHEFEKAVFLHLDQVISGLVKDELINPLIDEVLGKCLTQDNHSDLEFFVTCLQRCLIKRGHDDRLLSPSIVKLIVTALTKQEKSAIVVCAKLVSNLPQKMIDNVLDIDGCQPEVWP